MEKSDSKPTQLVSSVFHHLTGLWHGATRRKRGLQRRVANLLYAGDQLIGEYSAIQTRYVHGPGGDEPLVEYAGSGTTTPPFLLADERGSIIGRRRRATVIPFHPSTVHHCGSR
jgi:hypothetical protein